MRLAHVHDSLHQLIVSSLSSVTRLARKFGNHICLTPVGSCRIGSAVSVLVIRKLTCSNMSVVTMTLMLTIH